MIKAIRRFRQRHWLYDIHNPIAFRFGYFAALKDIEKSGMRPWRDSEKEKAAAKAYEKLIDE